MHTYTVLWEGEHGWMIAPLECKPDDLGRAWVDADYYGPFQTQAEAVAAIQAVAPTQAPSRSI